MTVNISMWIIFCLFISLIPYRFFSKRRTPWYHDLLLILFPGFGLLTVIFGSIFNLRSGREWFQGQDSLNWIMAVFFGAIVLLVKFLNTTPIDVVVVLLGCAIAVALALVLLVPKTLKDRLSGLVMLILVSSSLGCSIFLKSVPDLHVSVSLVILGCLLGLIFHTVTQKSM